MKLVSSVIGGIGLAVVVSMMTLGACGGDKSAVAGSGGTTAATGGDSNAGGNTSSDTAAAGGSINAGGTTSAGTTNPYVWTFFQDNEGWGTGKYPDTGTMTGEINNVQGQTFCDGGCEDLLITFNGETDQAVNFMRYGASLEDFTGKTLTAKIKVVDDTGVITAIDLHAQNGDTNHYKWGASASVTSSTTPSLATVISSTTAVTISTPIIATTDAGTIFDPSAVQGIGFNIAGKSGATGTAHLYVDSVEVTD